MRKKETNILKMFLQLVLNRLREYNIDLISTYQVSSAKLDSQSFADENW